MQDKSEELLLSRDKKLLMDIAYAASSGAELLDLSRRGLERLPKEIGSLTRLRTLDLSNQFDPESPLAKEYQAAVLEDNRRRFSEFARKLNQSPLGEEYQAALREKDERRQRDGQRRLRAHGEHDLGGRADHPRAGHGHAHEVHPRCDLVRFRAGY